MELLVVLAFELVLQRDAALLELARPELGLEELGLQIGCRIAT